jgi:hypothetical protein
MTPILSGRWQTRTLLLATAGLLITLLFTLIYGSTVFLYVLLYVWLFGLVWDVLYIGLQQFRWDRDWPSAFGVINGVLEGLLIYLVITFVGLPGIAAGTVPLLLFIAHYGLVWLSVFLLAQGPLRVIFPFWRFHGGRVFPRVSRREHGRG